VCGSRLVRGCSHTCLWFAATVSQGLVVVGSSRNGSRALTGANFTYAVFGVLLRSNVELPELTPLGPNYTSSLWAKTLLHPSIRLFLNISPHEREAPSGVEELRYASSDTDDAGNPALKIWQIAGGCYLRLAYYDGTQFWLDREGTKVWATWPRNLTIQDAATYLLGPILGFVLRLRGVTCLHASAVAFGERAVAFVGSQGAGKSTTAAALAVRGHAILSDDVVALAEHNGSFLVHPAYPYLCLWPESVQSIYGSAAALPPFSANYEKRCLSLRKQELRFAERPLPLAAIYILGDRRDDPAPLVESIPPQKAFLSLVANTFATTVIDGALRAKEFETLGRLAPIVPVRGLCAHKDAGRLTELCEKVSGDVEALNLRKSSLA
jgi:hypothetical protein